MALTKPFINSIPAFDANLGTTINLSVLGGDAITGYAFVIFDSSNNVVYSTPEIIDVIGDVESENIREFPISITSQMGLMNNKTYTIRPTTYHGALSQVGTGITFACYTKPIIRLYTSSKTTNPGTYEELHSGDTLNSVSPSLRVTFSANDLNSTAQPNVLQVRIYGVNDYGDQDILFDSGDIYSFSYNNTTRLYSTELAGKGLSVNVDFEGKLLPLANRIYSNFAFEVNCKTIENMPINEMTIDTESGTEQVTQIIGVNCYYSTISNSPNLVVNNLCDSGRVQIISKFTDIKGTSNPYPPRYIDNSAVDITNPGEWVKWADAFSVNIPYTIRLWVSNLQQGELLRLQGNEQKYVSLKYNIEDNYSFVSLEAGEVLSIDNVEFSHPYYIESQRILTQSITENTSLFIGIQAQGGLYDLDFEIEGDFSIITTLTNVSGDASNPIKISEGHTETLKFSADEGYSLPDTIVVSGATLSSWSKETGFAVISNPTGTVSITIVGVEPSYDPVFSNNDWATIKTVCQSGIIPATWEIGNTKTFTGTDNNTYTVRLSDKKQGRYTYSNDNTKTTNAVLELVETTPSGLGYNSTPTNEGGYAESLIRKNLNGYTGATVTPIINILPDEIKNLLEEVNIKSMSAGYPYTGQSTSSNKIFLLARGEVIDVGISMPYQEETINNGTEFGRYDYYATYRTGADRVKQTVGTTTEVPYWLRTPAYGSTNKVYGIVDGGAVDSTLTSSNYWVSFAWAW